MAPKFYFSRKTLLFTLLILFGNCNAEIWKCSSKTGALIYTDGACPKEMSGTKIYESPKTAVSEVKIVPLFSNRLTSADDRFTDGYERNSPQLQTDLATIKRARASSLGMGKDSKTTTAGLSNSKIDPSQKSSLLLSQRRWAYFVKEPK